MAIGIQNSGIQNSGIRKMATANEVKTDCVNENVRQIAGNLPFLWPPNTGKYVIIPISS